MLLRTAPASQMGLQKLPHNTTTSKDVLRAPGRCHATQSTSSRVVAFWMQILNFHLACRKSLSSKKLIQEAHGPKCLVIAAMFTLAKDALISSPAYWHLHTGTCILAPAYWHLHTGIQLIEQAQRDAMQTCLQLPVNPSDSLQVR